MVLIDETYIDDLIIKFYDGIDFNMILEHPKDGSKGFIYFFIGNWVEEMKIYKRDNKIDHIFGKPILDFNSDEIENNYIVIYQTNGHTMEIYKIIRERLHINQPLNWHQIVEGKII